MNKVVKPFGIVAVLLAAIWGVAQSKPSEQTPSSVTQVVALDECDPLTFNAALGPDFCRNVALGALGFSTTLQDLFAKPPRVSLIQAGTSSLTW